MFPGFNSLFNDFFDVDSYFPQMNMSQGLQQMRQHPAVNIIENDQEFRIEVSAPGMKKEDFSVDMEENRLTISAEHKYEHEESSNGDKNKGGKEKGKNNERYTRREFGYSQFSRSFMLPETVDPENIQAQYKDGILNLTLPKREDEKQRKQRRQISIK